MFSNILNKKTIGHSLCFRAGNRIYQFVPKSSGEIIRSRIGHRGFTFRPKSQSPSHTVQIGWTEVLQFFNSVLSFLR